MNQEPQPKPTKKQLKQMKKAVKAAIKQKKKDAKAAAKQQKKAKQTGPAEQNTPKKKKKSGMFSTILLLLILLVGAGVLAYPTFSDWWNSLHTTRAISSYIEAVDELSLQEREAMLEAARAYNEAFSPGAHFKLTDAQYAMYESMLDLTGTGIMGYIQIPSINVYLPIYHGVGEEVLQIAVGHIPGSSLPVGGESCHTVLSGHRGLPSARLFTDLDELVEGDLFSVTVLDQTLTYMVDQIRIVLPEEVSELSIQEGYDFCTLVTCTPYGVNTHRMLIRGQRIDNISDEVVVAADAVKIATYIVIPAVGVPLLFALLLIMLLYYRKKKPQKSYQEILEGITKS